MNSTTKVLLPLFLCFLPLFMISNSLLQAQDVISKKYATTISAGTNGIGGDFTLLISERLNTRIGFHGFNYTLNGTIEDSPDIEYDGNLSISSFSLLVDYYPFKKIIGLTAGLYLHSTSIGANAFPIETYEVGGKIFEVEELGSLAAKLNYSSNLMPYAGLVFSNPVASGIPLKLHMQLGILYSKAPNFEMSGTGMIAPTADNQVDLQEGLDEFNFLPVMKIGFSYRFGSRKSSE